MQSAARSDAGSSTNESSAKPKWPEWPNSTVVCIASGPSLTLEQVERVKEWRCGADRYVIAINDIGLTSRLPLAVPDCDLWYAADDTFWQFYSEQALKASTLRVCAAKHASELWHLSLDTTWREIFAWEPGKAASGGHSGFQALQIAINAGASKVILLGYDCKAQGKQTNAFGRKPNQIHRDSPYQTWPEWYLKLKQVLPRPINIVNCSLGSAITAFGYTPIEEALC